jgi:hypothetical protein
MYEMKNIPDIRFGSGGGALNMGVIPNSRVLFSVNPTANDVLGIGSATIKYVASLAAQTAQTQVKILGTAALTLAATINAINGTPDSNVVQGSTPVTATVVADAATATQLRLRLANARGLPAVSGVSASVALTASISGGASAWTNDNLNTMGKKLTDVREASIQFAFTAAMITALATGVFVELPFTPTVWQFEVTTSAGVGKWTVTDTLTASGNALVYTSAGATHAVAGDILSIWAQE